MISQAEKVLTQVFGFEQFKPLQKEIIANVLAKRDTLVIMPTGGGKSLCYQIPALILPGLTVVVSPLISLMKDQVEQLSEAGAPALFLNSSLSIDEYQENIARIRRGEIKLLYVAPETLLTPRLLDLLDSVKLELLAIDEAHCISEWGHDFRPEYRQMVGVRQRFPAAVCMALTATATPRVRQDIRESLGFRTQNEFIASFNRENLFLEITPKSDPTAQTIAFIRKFPEQSGIVYCFSRRQVDELAARLERAGFSVRPYHAGLSDEERKLHQELFTRDDVQIIVATIAFGMGINKPNVRFIVHYDLPKSLESYYQEIGRAGRDGLPAHCLLLYSYADVQKLKYFINQKEETERQAAYAHLDALIQYAEADVCRRIPLLVHFGERYAHERCDACDNCITAESRQVDITRPAQMLLSCIKRTGELFGAGHLVDVLLGEDTAKIRKFNHQSVSTYGIGKELSRQQWLRLSRQLLHKGYILQDERYGSLKLTSKAYDFFKSKEPISGILEADSVERKGKKGEAEYDRDLFERLRALRKELADAARVPPYVIFADRTLIEMATYYPTRPESLGKIFGIGARKLERYGKQFAAAIQAYCEEKGLGERARPAANRTGQGAPTSRLLPEEDGQKARHIVVGEAYNAGKTVAQIMEDFDIQQGTVLNHLAKYLMDGYTLREDGLLTLCKLPAEQQERTLAAFQQHGAEFLKPAYEALNGEIEFEDLKILRLYYLSRAQNGKAG